MGDQYLLYFVIYVMILNSQPQLGDIMTERFAGKHAVVTGAANGIGKATALRLLAEGAIVTAVDRDEAAIEAMRQSGASSRLKTVAGDITNSAFAKELFATGSVDILVNNAGVDLPYNPLTKDRDNWSTVMDVNLHGTRMFTEEALANMSRGGRPASIIFIASVHTAFAFPGGGAYDASKCALIGYMRSLAYEFGSWLRSNAISPGVVFPTNITASISGVQAEELAKLIPEKRFGAPEEIASVVAFLASDDASYVNCAEIRVDGGLAIQTPLPA